jgi:hypothetical protein
MTVSKVLNREQFNTAIEHGIYTVLGSMVAEIITQKDTEYEYYKVNYINAALYESTFFVAVHK